MRKCATAWHQGLAEGRASDPAAAGGPPRSRIAVVPLDAKGLFDEGRHPRDAHGRWVMVGGAVHLADGAAGKVTGVRQGGKVEVELAGGGRREVDAREVTQAGETAAKPAGGARRGFAQMHGFTPQRAPQGGAARASEPHGYAPLTDAEYDAHRVMVERKVKQALDAGMATHHSHTLDPAGEIYTPNVPGSTKRSWTRCWPRRHTSRMKAKA